MSVNLLYHLLVYQSKELPIDSPLASSIYFFTCVTPHIKSKGLPIDGLLASNLCFLYAQHRIQKVRGSQLAVPQYLTNAFYMCSAAYKKQGTPD
jgi:hypothetical protein